MIITDPYVYKAHLVRVVDGDTVDADLDLGFGVAYHRRLRLWGINAPETRTRDAEEKAAGLLATAALLERLISEPHFYVQTLKDTEGKYGRPLAILWTSLEADVSINQYLVDSGLAVPYMDGGVYGGEK